MIPHSLTNENYFSSENNRKYMSASQFKSFMKCEAETLAEIEGKYQREVTDALLIGSFVDAHFEGGWICSRHSIPTYSHETAS